MTLAFSMALTMALADGNGTNAGRKGASSTAGGVRSTAPENKLVGIALYATGIDVVRKFGSPDQILALGGGGTGQIGPAGAGGGPTGANAGPGGAPAQGGGGAGGAGATGIDNLRGKDWGTTEFFLQGGRGREDLENAGLTGGAPQGGPGPGAQGPGGGGGAGAPAAIAGSRLLFTRGVYKRGNSRFAFILDKFNHVIQIEAIGTADSRVYTNRGIRYGSQVKDIILRYGAPDAYEIQGDQIVMRYLINSHVAFRLNRLQTDRPHVVTGIVVAAGKA